MNTEKQLVIIGAGGHGRVAQDIANYTYSKIVFLDDSDIKHENVVLVGKTKDYIKYIGNSDFFVAIGNNSVREKVSKMIESSGANIVSLIHTGAIISNSVNIGAGSMVMAGAVINANANIGAGCIVNTCSSIDHDCTIDEFCHISVGAHLAGTVQVGARTFIGAGATVINNIDICADCMIGAGAVVVKDIEKSGTYVGVPAVMKIK